MHVRAAQPTYIKRKPRIRGTEQNLEVGPLAEVGGKVAAARLGDLGALDDGIGVNDESAGGEEGVDVLGGLLDVALDIHGEARGLGDGEAEVEGEHAGDAAETDEETPAEIDVVGVADGIVEDLVLEGRDDDEGDEGSGKVPEALHGKDGIHHAATVADAGELGGDDCGQRIVTTDADAHDEAPDEENTNERDGGTMAGDGLSKGAEDDWVQGVIRSESES